MIISLQEEAMKTKDKHLRAIVKIEKYYESQIAGMDLMIFRLRAKLLGKELEKYMQQKKKNTIPQSSVCFYCVF